MRYAWLVYIALVLILFAVVPSVSADEVWRPPQLCDDEDRTTPGNRLSPCHSASPTLTTIEYHVIMTYPTCTDTVALRMDGFGPAAPPDNVRVVALRMAEGNPNRSRSVLFRVENFGSSGWFPNDAVVGDGYFTLIKGQFGLDSRLTNLEPVLGRYGTTGTKVYALIVVGNSEVDTNAIPIPPLISRQEGINACLAQVEREKTEREAAARATVAAQELIELREAQAAIVQTELVKTQALIDEVAHQEARTAILQEIVRIRLAGEADRQRILNEYLTRARQTSEDFDLETSGVEETINEYIEFNRRLMEEISGYQEALHNRIESLEQQAAELEAELERLREQQGETE